MVGGGTGVYPMLFCSTNCANEALNPVLLWFRSRAHSVLTDDFKEVADYCVIASEAGDLDVTGNVMVALEQVGNQFHDSGSVAVLTCGPKPMMQKVAAYASANGFSCPNISGKQYGLWRGTLSCMSVK